MRLRLDSAWLRVGEGRELLLAGSPLRLFRLSHAGADQLDQLERGDEVASPLVDRLLDAGALHPVSGTPSAFGLDDVMVVTPQLGGAVRVDRDVTVDDGSTPPLAGASYRLDVNRGPSAARNVGRGLVDTALVAFVDADVDLPFDRSDEVASRAWWEPLLSHFDDPRVALVAPRVIGDGGASLDLGAEPARIRAGSRVSYVPGAAIIVRGSAFDHVGGFDERMRLGEDVDLVWRLDQAGWHCRFEPASTVIHHRRGTWRARIRQQVGYGESSAPLAMRHPRALAPFRSTGWTAATWWLALVARPWAALATAAAGTAVLIRRLPGVPPTVLVRLTVAAHARSAVQLAGAARRVWWPIIAIAGIGSRRWRRLAFASVALAPHRLVRDLAFGWGVWTGVVRHREWRPLAPDVTSWP